MAFLSLAGCVGVDIDSTSAPLTTGDALTVVSTSIPVRIKPGGKLAYSITVRNSGTTTWKTGAVVLTYAGDAGFTGTTLALPATTKPNATVTFSGTLGASTQIGRYALAWQATDNGVAFGPTISATTEITCSDGIFCNGDERYVNGRCVGGPPPCDDGEDCTVDSCDEATKLCGHVLSSPDCTTCAAKNCNGNCHGATCGDDGCGNPCGVGACDFGFACIGGACAPAVVPGTCANPLTLVAGTPANAIRAPGTYTVLGDNTDGYDEVQPYCDAIAAPEKVYELVVDQKMGIDAQSFGIDTVLAIYQSTCASKAINCSDDAAPPGNFGSHISMLLDPGTYLIAVNGFDTHAVGPFTLQIRLVPNCLPQCDGKFCGDDGCGFSCGECGTGEHCDSKKCVPDNCVPDCAGRQCGSDGCGSDCGLCQEGKSCDEPTGACKNVSTCDHDRPVCASACSSQEYCGTDCACHRVRDARPDLVVDRDSLADNIKIEELNIGAASCTLVEQCVGGPGLRRLLRFEVEAVNQGNATLTVPPPKDRPDLFEFSSCHGHYHFKGFASYALLDGAGNVILNGKKLAYCMEDTRQVVEGPGIGCEKVYDCDNQGIQAGWSDIYGNSLDCQWLDITGVAAGNYQLRVTVNPGHYFEEASFDNNTTTIPVTIP